MKKYKSCRGRKMTCTQGRLDYDWFYSLKILTRFRSKVLEDFLHYVTQINCLTGAIISETYIRHILRMNIFNDYTILHNLIKKLYRWLGIEKRKTLKTFVWISWKNSASEVFFREFQLHPLASWLHNQVWYLLEKKCIFTIVCEVEFLEEISTHTERTYRTYRGKARLKITDWQNTELDICFSNVKGKGLKHAGKSHQEICKGANMKTAWRALDFPLYTVKQSLPFSRPQPGCHWPNSLWAGKTKLLPPRKSLISDIPAGDGKTANPFLQCISFLDGSASKYEHCLCF